MAGPLTGTSKETIIIVHGTFSAHVAEVPKWWHPTSRAEFIPRLHQALEARGVAARCWAHCEEGLPVFHWRGRNNWIDRADAAAQLAQYLRDLSRAGWTCHVVAHSHGGNVIVDALRILRGSGEERSVASVVTLGTPFVDVSPSIERQQRRSVFDLWSTIYLTLLLVLIYPFVRLWQQNQLTAEKLAGAVVNTLGWLVIFALFLLIRHWAIRRKRRVANEGAPNRTLPALAINSHYDEAWQLLHHIRETVSPLAVTEGIAAYLYRRIKSYLHQRSEIARIFGTVRFGDLKRWQKAICVVFFILVLLAPVIDLVVFAGGEVALPRMVALLLLMYVFGFLVVAILSLGAKWLMGAYLWPWWYAGFLLQAPLIVPSEIGIYIGRRQSWPILQRLVMGLDGYRFDLPRVSMLPENAGAAEFVFQPMLPEVERRALDGRSEWISRHLGSAAMVFSRIVLSASEISTLLSEVEGDQTLVHAAYYTDADCIPQITEWIAGHRPAVSLPQAELT